MGKETAEGWLEMWNEIMTILCDGSESVNKDLTSGGSFSGLLGRHPGLRTLKQC